MGEYTVSKVVISASHNIHATQAQANRLILAKAHEDIAAQKTCVSYNFRRAADAKIDENKALMPIYGKVPMLAHKIIHRIKQDLDVIVIGSNEVRTVVESLQEFLDVDTTRLRYVNEQRSLGQNMSAGARAAGGAYCFEAADTPLSYDISDVLKDSDIEDNLMVADLNARQRIFGETPEFFPRNYYWEVSNGSGEAVSAKEPNVWTVSEKFPFEIIDEFYKTRQGGRLGIPLVMKLFGWNLLKNMHKYSKEVYYDLAGGLWRSVNKLVGRRLPLHFHTQTVSDLSQALFDRPMKMKATHTDPFRLKDVDAWHDLWFYHHVISQAKHEYGDSGLEKIIPHADIIQSYDDHIRGTGLDQSIGVLRDFEAYACERSLELGMPAPFNDGRLCAPPAHGERIDQALTYLMKKKKDYTSATTNS
jgi:hypothetical protein